MIDLNADLGEGEPAARTRALMRIIDSANIACGGHAGTLRSMELSVRLARECGAAIGAHPGFVATGNFGRAPRTIDAGALELLLLQQAGALDVVARRAGGQVRHVKLHGALYHAVEASRPLARRYVEVVRDYFPGLRIVGFAGSSVVACADRLGVEAWGEAFADRGYLDDGRLVPRGQAGDLVTDPAEVVRRIRQFVETGRMPSVTGKFVPVNARTICVHADTANAVTIARRVARVLRGPG